MSADVAAPARRDRGLGRTAAAAAARTWRRRGTVARLHEPVDRRLHGLLRLPAASRRVVPVVHALRPALAAALDRAGQLPLLLPGRPAGLARRSRTRRGSSAFGVPLQVLFALRHRHAARARAGTANGFFRTVFYLPALVPPVAAALGFVYLLNPATGPVNTRAGQVRDRAARCGSTTRRGRSRRWSCSALWGIGNTMIIFLAALLDVPRHLYEAAQLDGAGGLQRLRQVTLPAISAGPPVRRRHRRHRRRCSTSPRPTSRAASSAAASQRRRTRPIDLGYPRGLDAVLSAAALPAGLPLLQHGLRVGDGDRPAASSSFAVTAMIIRNSRRWVHYQAGMR